jgi:hypothetical protein
MDFLQKPFEYNIQSLVSTESNLLVGALFLTVGIVMYFGMILLDEKMEDYKQTIAIKKKKEALQDMILMKDIQEEIDVEMKEALIREELRAKK